MGRFPGTQRRPLLGGICLLLATNSCAFDRTGLAPSGATVSDASLSWSEGSGPRGDARHDQSGTSHDGTRDAGGGVPDRALAREDGRSDRLVVPESGPDTALRDLDKSCGDAGTRCWGLCVDTQNNDSHCGSCDHPCGADEACSRGICCPLSEENCAGNCASLLSSAAHCGSCGQACSPSERCSKGKCCPSGEGNCGGSCYDLSSSPTNCGRCGHSCAAGETCDNGLCCPRATRNCDGQCVNLRTDIFNCGSCNKVCAFNELCIFEGCAPFGCSSIAHAEQVFSATMRGCGGRVAFSQRSSLCAPSFFPCSALQWVTRRDGVSPAYNYWTDDDLRYEGTGSGRCSAALAGIKCTGNTPMRVCADTTDPLGNRCTWARCGYNNTTPNEYFGGCADNSTAGTLCCR